MGPFSFPSAVWLKTTSMITCLSWIRIKTPKKKKKKNVLQLKCHLNSLFMCFSNKKLEFIYCITARVTHTSRRIFCHRWKVIDSWISPKVNPGQETVLCYTLHDLNVRTCCLSNISERTKIVLFTSFWGRQLKSKDTAKLKLFSLSYWLKNKLG